MREILDERRAVGIVNALVDSDSCSCSDCGAEIDVSEAETSAQVVETLETHRQTHADSGTEPDGDVDEQ